MKYTFPAIALACLLAAGCQQKKPATTESVTDLSTTSNTSQVSYASPTPIQTIAPEPIATPTMATSIASTGTTYTIKPGDTLWKIAATHYGDGKKWKQISDANPGVTPQKLKVGQTITLP